MERAVITSLWKTSGSKSLPSLLDVLRHCTALLSKAWSYNKRITEDEPKARKAWALKHRGEGNRQTIRLATSSQENRLVTIDYLEQTFKAAQHSSTSSYNKTLKTLKKKKSKAMKSVPKYDRKTRNTSQFSRATYNIPDLLPMEVISSQVHTKAMFPKPRFLDRFSRLARTSQPSGSEAPRHLGWRLPPHGSELSTVSPIFRNWPNLLPSVATYFYRWDPLSPDFPLSLSNNHLPNSSQASTPHWGLWHSCRSGNTRSPDLLSYFPPHSSSEQPPLLKHPSPPFLKSSWSN